MLRNGELVQGESALKFQREKWGFYVCVSYILTMWRRVSDRLSKAPFFILLFFIKKKHIVVLIHCQYSLVRKMIWTAMWRMRKEKNVCKIRRKLTRRLYHDLVLGKVSLTKLNNYVFHQHLLHFLEITYNVVYIMICLTFSCIQQIFQLVLIL